MCLIEWRSPDRAEELIVVFNRNVINLYFTANSLPRFEDQTHTEGVRTQPGRTRFILNRGDPELEFTNSKHSLR